jgi:GPH family glycoside/pentoside/hexuronide:cation symporter
MSEGNKTKRLSNIQLLAWALPALVLSLTMVPVNAVLPTLYAQHAKVSVAAVGTIFLLRSIYDAVSDQLIGFLSDRTRTRMGARLPWILSGGVVTIVGMLMLFRIPPDAGVVYFTVWTLVFFTGATMVGIPYFAWGNELTSDYDESSRVFAFKGFFENVGSMLFSVIPIVLVFFGIMLTTEYTPDMVWLLGMIVLVAMPVTLIGAFFLAPRGMVSKTPRTTLMELFRSVKDNRPFQRFIAAYLIAGTGYGFFVALVYPFIASYLQIGEAFPMILLVATISGLISVPLWIRIVYLLGKHRAWAWGWLFNSVVLLPMIWVEPGESAAIPTAVMMGLYGLTNGVSAIAPFSILGDVVDYDRLRTGVDRGGNYFAFMMFAVKMLGSTGGVALIVLGAVFGYELAEGAVNSDFANAGMLYMFILAPGIFQLASLPLIWNFPIDERRQLIIRRRLESLDARALRETNPGAGL